MSAGLTAAEAPSSVAAAWPCWRRGSAGARTVGPGEDFQVVAAGVLEVHPTAAVVVVDLAGPAAVRIRPVLHAALADAAVDGVELVLGDQERVMLRADVLVLAHLRVVETHAVVELDSQEGAEFLGAG